MPLLAAFPVSLPGLFACWEVALSLSPEDGSPQGGTCLEQAQSYFFSNC